MLTGKMYEFEEEVLKFLKFSKSLSVTFTADWKILQNDVKKFISELINTRKYT